MGKTLQLSTSSLNRQISVGFFWGGAALIPTDPALHSWQGHTLSPLLWFMPHTFHHSSRRSQHWPFPPLHGSYCFHWRSRRLIYSGKLMYPQWGIQRDRSIVQLFLKQIFKELTLKSLLISKTKRSGYNLNFWRLHRRLKFHKQITTIIWRHLKSICIVIFTSI